MSAMNGYEAARTDLIRLISQADEHGRPPRLDRMVLNNREAPAVLKMAPAKDLRIPLSELPRKLAKGRGGVKIAVIAIADYLIKEAGFGGSCEQELALGASTGV